jgi:hypothetical protein
MKRPAARARPRCSTGTYHRPNSPIATPVTQVQVHQRWPAGSAPPTEARISMTTRAITQPAVIVPVTSLSFASRGGARRLARLARSDLACGSPVTSLG